MTRITRKYEVCVAPCSQRERDLTRSTVVCAENREEATDRAVAKMYGSRCFWFPDSGLPGYGQVFEALQPTHRNSQPGNSAVTMRASLDVKPTAPKSRALRAQEAEDAAEQNRQVAWQNELDTAYYAGKDAAHHGTQCPRFDDYIKSHECRRGYENAMLDIEEERSREENDE